MRLVGATLASFDGFCDQTEVGRMGADAADIVAPHVQGGLSLVRSVGVYHRLH